jgi:uncharacterized sporulation protein YeaH/YhbH (DUF444 family)
MKKKLISVIEETIQQRNSSPGNDTIYVYLAADNQQVKEAFAAEISKDENQGLFGFSMNLMTVDTKFVHHIKHLATMKSATNDEGKCMHVHTYARTYIRTHARTISRTTDFFISLLVCLLIFQFFTYLYIYLTIYEFPCL